MHKKDERKSDFFFLGCVYYKYKAQFIRRSSVASNAEIALNQCNVHTNSKVEHIASLDDVL